MTTITAPRSAPTARRHSLTRAPQLTAWAALMGVSEVVRFAGFMTLLVAMCVEAGARRVIDHEEA
ncbi:hypothetical protein [Curtobacterium flaccumfaciens]|uniref:hypothetical protein n=1 Tax=Curtobacterium flaccumfaciens TaxID=2035 RepID=UPI00217D5358|nr:hypothetical protein [Curtobacterium flaccumfaciens]MCS6554639.1 hypothetical protein [Curtobacterium flaccumfaciens]